MPLFTLSSKRKSTEPTPTKTFSTASKKKSSD